MTRVHSPIKPETFSLEVFGDFIIDRLSLKNDNFHKHSLRQIIHFVNSVVNLDGLPFVLHTTETKQTWIPDVTSSLYFRRIPSFIDAVNKLPVDYEYCEHITAFIDVCNELGIVKAPSPWATQRDLTANTLTDFKQLSTAEIYNLIVHGIRSMWRTEKLNERWHKRCIEVAERFNEYSRYILSLFAQNGRLIVIRLDLSYSKETSHLKTADDAISDLDHFLTNRRFNSTFRGIKGYIAKLEYGPDKGIHWHTIFFFDGAIRRPSSHINLAYELGNYWIITITKGDGIFWNCNAEHSNFAKRGIRGFGDIKAEDKMSIHNLIYRVLGYLCKTEQYIRPKLESKQQRVIRRFRRGNFPKTSPTKKGRPRIAA